MDRTLLARVDAWLDAHLEEILLDLDGLVRVPSVSDAESDIKPFGQPCRDALEYMFRLGRRHGYETRNFDHYIGAIEFTKGERTVGLWAHLDVVPVGDPAEWVYPPFEMTRVDGRYLIGRGIQDNKMPAIGVFHAMNCLRDLGVTLRHGYTLYMGTNEERGMADVRWFVDHHRCPDLSLVPDCGFPVCIAQRGAMTLRVSVPLKARLRIEQSNHPSVTPETVDAVFASGERLSASGESCHIYKAENAENANLALLKMLAERCPEDAPALNALRALCGDWRGAGLDLACSDELSGCLQMAPTRMSAEGGRLSADVFCILPVSFDDAILDRAQRAAQAAGATVEVVRMRRPVGFSADHPIVPLLTGVYNEVTGRSDAPFVMSGGNYAAYLPNAFGYGPGMPGREFPPHIFRPGHGDYHQCDESEDVEHIRAFMRVYAMSLVALDQTDDFGA